MLAFFMHSTSTARHTYSIQTYCLKENLALPYSRRFSTLLCLNFNKISTTSEVNAALLRLKTTINLNFCNLYYINPSFREIIVWRLKNTFWYKYTKTLSLLKCCCCFHVKEHYLSMLCQSKKILSLKELQQAFAYF